MPLNRHLYIEYPLSLDGRGLEPAPYSDTGVRVNYNSVIPAKAGIQNQGI